MLSERTLDKKVATLKKLKAQQKELEEMITKIEDSLKAEMEERKEYKLEGKTWKVTWDMVTSSRFDQNSFKEAHPKLFESYKKPSSSRRFLLS